MIDKVCLVTGANRGIGRQVVRLLAGRGATVILVCRDAKRGNDAASEIAARTGNDNLELLCADMSSMQNIRQLAAEFKERHNRLDVLVNNAATVTHERRETVDGFERQLAVNYLAPFLLTHLLLDRLILAGDGRIINVSSRAHWRGRIRFDDINWSRGYGRWSAYSQSKLGNVMFTYEMARRMAGSDVAVNAVHPGLIYTGLAKDLTNVPGWLNWLQRSVSGDEQQGARTIVYLATSPQVRGVSGKYFANCRTKQTSPASRNRDAQRRLWQLSEEMVGLAHHTVPPVSD